MAKLKLDSFFEYEIDFFLLGLSCHLPDYRLAYLLNQKLDIDLIRQNDLDLRSNKKADPSYFSYFQHDDEEAYITVNLISNRSATGFFASEVKQLDYFLQLWIPEVEGHDLTWFKKQVNQLSQVLACVEIDPHELKSKEHFMF